MASSKSSGQSLLFVIVVCLMLAYIFYLQTNNSNNGTDDNKKPDDAVVAALELTKENAAKLCCFHRDLATVLDRNQDKYTCLAQFKEMYEMSWSVCYGDSIPKRNVIGEYVCLRINNKLNIKNQRDLKRKLSEQDKSNLIEVLTEISKELGRCSN